MFEFALVGLFKIPFMERSLPLSHSPLQIFLTSTFSPFDHKMNMRGVLKFKLKYINIYIYIF